MTSDRPLGDLISDKNSQVFSEKSIRIKKMKSDYL